MTPPRLAGCRLFLGLARSRGCFQPAITPQMLLDPVVAELTRDELRPGIAGKRPTSESFVDGQAVGCRCNCALVHRDRDNRLLRHARNTGCFLAADPRRRGLSGRPLRQRPSLELATVSPCRSSGSPVCSPTGSCFHGHKGHLSGKHDHHCRSPPGSSNGHLGHPISRTDWNENSPYGRDCLGRCGGDHPWSPRRRWIIKSAR